MPTPCLSSRTGLSLGAAALVLLAACNEDTILKTSHPMISVDPLALDFGQLEAGQKKKLTLTLSNVGTGELRFDGTLIRNDSRSAFTAGTLPERLSQGDSVSLEVTYLAPALEGPDGAQLVVESDADNAPELAISLSGRVASACASGLFLCGGLCVDTLVDDDHCGGCDTVCTAPKHCLQGHCECLPRTCADLGECGDGDDGCGKTLTCPTCPSPKVCTAHKCVPPSCTDKIKNADETDVDCGGSCAPCALDGACSTTDDCKTGLVCLGGKCSKCTAKADCRPDQICASGLCSPCNTASECGADHACQNGKCLSCPTEAAFNECGLCGGPTVSGLGASCLTSTGCASTLVCNALKNGLDCPPVNPNECGLCNGPAVTGLGNACTASSGCPSTLVCNAAKDGTTCQPVVKNACGVCGGPVISGLGSQCIDAEGCASTYVCNGEGTGVVCAHVGRNECNVCGGPAVPNVGDACTAASGCPSTLACNNAGTGTVCTPVTKNECNVCGGPPVSGIGTNCTDSFGCLSTYTCNAQGLGITCPQVGRNECGLCGGIPVSGIGDACTTANGCPSTLACSTDLAHTTCTAVAKNACGVCGGPTLPANPGSSCYDTAGCASTYACNGDGTAVSCTFVGRNECNKCGGPAVPNLGATCTTAEGCSSTLACNGTNDDSVCTYVPKNACGLCNGPTITGLGNSCTGTSGCTGEYICNADKNGVECSAPATCNLANHVVISQICGAGANGSNDDFIELYNPTSSAISVAGWTLWYRSASSTSTWNALLTTPLSGSIQPHGYLLLVYDATGASYSFPSIPKDFGFKMDIGGSAGQLVLWKISTTPPQFPAPSDPNYVDFVGYGTSAAYFETAKASGPGSAGAIIRKAKPSSSNLTMRIGGADALLGNGVDSDDNLNDFTVLGAGQFAPRNSASTPRP